MKKIKIRCTDKNKKETITALLCIGIILLSILTIQTAGLYHGNRYNLTNYCCRHMSRDLEDQLETLGLPVTICTGYKNKTGHCWIRIGPIHFDSVWLTPFYNGKNKYPTYYTEYNDYYDYCPPVPTK